MLEAPCAHRIDDRKDRSAQVCDVILHARWYLRKNLSFEQTILFQLPQLHGEHLLADVWNSHLQLAKTIAILANEVDDHRLPFAPDEVDAVGDRTIVGIKTFIFPHSQAIYPLV